MKHPMLKIEMWIKRIVGHEGGFSLDPKDKGNWTTGKVGKGELKGTKWGISASAYPHLNIRNLTVQDAADIYKKDYLDLLRADSFEDGVAFQLLDFAINSGVAAAKKGIQKAVNVKPDGVIGPVTLKAILSYTEADMIMLLLATRLEFLTSAPTWPDHGRGWVRRVAQNLKYGVLDS